jgi:hypothetical protein
MLDVFEVKRSADSDDVLKRVNGQFEKVINVASTPVTLEDVESSAVVVVEHGSAATVNLPTIEAGLCYKFFINSAQAHIISAGVNLIQGAIYDNSNGTTLARTAVTNQATITLANPVIGDCLEFHCDGTNWYVHGWLNDTPSLGTV